MCNCLLLFMQGYASISREPCITLQKTWSQSFEEGCFLKFALRVALNVCKVNHKLFSPVGGGRRLLLHHILGQINHCFKTVTKNQNTQAAWHGMEILNQKKKT